MAREELDMGQGEPALPCRLPYPTTLLVVTSRVPAAIRQQKPAVFPA
jgi:hypothetical protein